MGGNATGGTIGCGDGRGVPAGRAHAFVQTLLLSPPPPLPPSSFPPATPRLRSLQCKLVLPRLRGLLPDKALKVKLVISSGQGLVVTAMAKAENDKPGAEAVVRALALDQLQVAVLGEVSKPGAQRGASAARARAGARDEPTRASRLQRLASSGRLEEVARTFSVLCAHGLGEVLVFRTELPEAAATWVRTINAKLADQQSITRQGTFGRHAEDELNERPRAARARDTQRIRL